MGKASNAAKGETPAGKVEGRVTVDGTFGKVNDIVLVDEGVEYSEVDTAPAAVAYAKSLAADAANSAVDGDGALKG